MASSGNIFVGAPGSSSGPFLDLTKNFGSLFNQAQGLGKDSSAAENSFRALGDQLGSLFENYGAGQRQQINQRFDTQKNNALGSLAKRGFSGSSLAGSTGSAAERDRSLSLGAFEDSLLGQRIGAAQTVTQGLAGAQMGGADISQRLREALLGLNQSNSLTSGGGGGGGGGSKDSGFDSGIGDSPDYYGDAIKRLLGGATGAGGSGGGSGGGGGGQQASQPGFIDNPYGAPAQPKGGVPDWAADPNKVKEMGGFSSTGPPGEVGETYTVGGLTCTVTANKGNHSERSCVPTSALDQPAGAPPDSPPATGGIPGDLGGYENVA